MSNGIPYVRHVRYTDDGCDVWQCLSCKQDWESRSQVAGDWPEMKYFKYCPYCGLEWAGQHKWDEQKKWNLGHGQVYASERARTERLRPLKFKLQERFIPLDNSGKDLEYEEAGAWQFRHESLRDGIVAAQALRELQQQEDDDDHMFGRHEYRAVPEETK